MSQTIKTILESGRIIVTGGNGFVGSHVIDCLIERGFGVTVLDRYGEPHRPDVDFVLGDVRNQEIVNQLASNHAGIINLAGILGTSETVEDPFGTVSTNLCGALNVFNAVRDYKIRGVQITVGNYWMNNPYAITKNASEKLAFYYNKLFGSKIAMVRGLNAYGERQKKYPVRKLMPNLVIPAIGDEEILIYGDGLQKMDMIYVGDLAEVLVRALVLEHGVWDHAIEAGSGDDTTVNEIVETVIKVVGSKSKVTHIEMRAGEPKRAVVVGNPETMRPLGLTKESLLGLEEGIKLTQDYYIKNSTI